MVNWKSWCLSVVGVDLDVVAGDTVALLLVMMVLSGGVDDVVGGAC